MYAFTVHGDPKGKARPRFVRAGAGVRTYTPKTTAEYERTICEAYKAAGGEKMDGPIEVRIVAFFRIPKSATVKERKAKGNGKERPTKKPDLDNIAKVVMDALNGVAYRDDSQVVYLLAVKHYGAEPRIEVQIEEAWAWKKK